MPRALTFSNTESLTWTYTNAQDLSTPEDKKTLPRTPINLTDGTGANKANRIWHDKRTLANATSETIDMFDLAISGGAAGEDHLGQAVQFAKIKFIRIQNLNTTAGNKLLIGGEGSAAAWNSPFNASDTAKNEIGAGGVWEMGSPVDGFTVTDVSNHLLKVDNPGSASIDYEIIIVGEQ